MFCDEDTDISRKEFPVRVCPECDIIWESGYDHSLRRRARTIYKEFPRYGLKRERCVECKQ